MAPLSAGGMGDVYRAKDLRLGREVVVKVLPSAVAEDPVRLERFEREARAAAALSHPSILAIYDFASHERTSYAVTELLEGETLRERLAAGALPPRKAAEITVQVTHGLAAAHEKGIVHRDIKRENLFLRAGQLTATPFDAERGVTTGEPFPLLESVSAPYGFADYALSSVGTLVYRRRVSDRALTWVTRDGRELGVLASGRAYQHPRLAPDGRQVAVEVDTGAQSQVWIADAARGTVTLMTTDGDGRFPIWGPDGQHVTFSSQRQGGRRLFRQSTDGGGADSIDPVVDPQHDTDGSWSPDGHVLAYTALVDGLWRIFVLRPGGGQPQRFLPVEATNWEARFSPDGRWVAYASDESGRSEVYVRSFPGAGHRTQVSVDGGHDPAWARGGHELFYQRGGQLYAVPILGARPISFGEPRLLFEGPYMALEGAANYDVTADGQRFLMVKVSEEDRRPTRLEVVVNWFEELKGRSPGSGAPAGGAHP